MLVDLKGNNTYKSKSYIIEPTKVKMDLKLLIDSSFKEFLLGKIEEILSEGIDFNGDYERTIKFNSLRQVENCETHILRMEIKYQLRNEDIFIETLCKAVLINNVNFFTLLFSMNDTIIRTFYEEDANTSNKEFSIGSEQNQKESDILIGINDKIGKCGSNYKIYKLSFRTKLNSNKSRPHLIIINSSLCTKVMCYNGKSNNGRIVLSSIFEVLSWDK